MDEAAPFSYSLINTIYASMTCPASPLKRIAFLSQSNNALKTFLVIATYRPFENLSNTIQTKASIANKDITSVAGVSGNGRISARVLMKPATSVNGSECWARLAKRVVGPGVTATYEGHPCKNLYVLCSCYLQDSRFIVLVREMMTELPMLFSRSFPHVVELGDSAGTSSYLVHGAL